MNNLIIFNFRFIKVFQRTSFTLCFSSHSPLPGACTKCTVIHFFPGVCHPASLLNMAAFSASLFRDARTTAGKCTVIHFVPGVRHPASPLNMDAFSASRLDDARDAANRFPSSFTA